MSDGGESNPARKPRTDAKRNRDRLLGAAKEAFAAKGAAASLEQVAKSAGVGIGTLYRHFPTRDALVEAVYRHETEHLIAAAGRLQTTDPPLEALRQWLHLFVDYMAAKRGMSEVLNALDGGASGLYATSGPLVKQAINALVERAAGEIRSDGFDPFDLLRAIGGVAHYAAGPGWEPAARRLVDILVEGLRAR